MKKALFISYFWPPSGKASLHWPLFIIKHLPKSGWQPLVLTIDEDTFSQRDESLVKEVDPTWKVVRTAANEPFALYRRLLGKKSDEQLVASEAISLEERSFRHKLAIWVRMNLFIPDARVGWYFSAVRGGKRLLEDEGANAVVSIGPPHTSHLIGARLGRLKGIPHIPVFIDPWVDIAYYRDFTRSAPTLALDRYFERKVLKKAAKSVFVTKSMEEDYRRKYPWLAEKTCVLYWGFNEESFAGLAGGENAAGEKIILHAGNMFDYQNAEGLWRNIADEIRRGTRMRLRFIGTVGPAIRSAVTRWGLTQHTDYVGFLPYPAAVKQMMDASYLLVCATEKRHVPGKLFEYLRTGKPIIAFGDENKEVEAIIREADAGAVFPYAYDAGDIFQRLNSVRPNPDASKKYSREHIALQFAQLLDSLNSD